MGVHEFVLPVIIHDCQCDADMLHTVLGDIKDKGFIVTGVERVLLDGRLALLQPPPFTNEGCLDVRILREGRSGWRKEMARVTDKVTQTKPIRLHPMLLAELPFFSQPLDSEDTVTMVVVSAPIGPRQWEEMLRSQIWVNL